MLNIEQRMPDFFLNTGKTRVRLGGISLSLILVLAWCTVLLGWVMCWCIIKVKLTFNNSSGLCIILLNISDMFYMSKENKCAKFGFCNFRTKEIVMKMSEVGVVIVGWPKGQFPNQVLLAIPNPWKTNHY